MIIYCDGVFDLFHNGHINHFKQIKQLYPNSYLIVGVVSDSDASSYKRIPFFNYKIRHDLVFSTKYVDKCIEAQLLLDEIFLDKYQIDLVVHAFNDKNDLDKQQEFFSVPIKLNKLQILDYTHGVSTTAIIKSINNSSLDILQKVNNKGDRTITNILELDRYNETGFNYKNIALHIISKFNLVTTDKVLEFGCGSGLIGKHFYNKYDYYGVDSNDTLINKNLKLFKNKVINYEVNRTSFKDNYFDYSFSIGEFEYFPNTEYTREVINEMERVTKTAIYILNIRKELNQIIKSNHKSKDEFQHLIYEPSFFEGFEILESLYDKNLKFSIYKKLIN